MLRTFASLSYGWLHSLYSQFFVGNTRVVEALHIVEDISLPLRMQAWPLLDAAAFAAACTQHAATRGRFGWVARLGGRQTSDVYLSLIHISEPTRPY